MPKHREERERPAKRSKVKKPLNKLSIKHLKDKIESCEASYDLWKTHITEPRSWTDPFQVKELVAQLSDELVTLRAELASRSRK